MSIAYFCSEFPSGLLQPTLDGASTMRHISRRKCYCPIVVVPSLLGALSSKHPSHESSKLLAEAPCHAQTTENVAYLGNPSFKVSNHIVGSTFYETRMECESLIL